MGIGLAHFLDDLRPEGEDFLPFALFMGAAMSITAFPVLARILTDRRMHRTETGGLALACAAVDDVLAWTILAVVIAIAGGEGHGHGPDWIICARGAVRVVRVAGGASGADRADPDVPAQGRADARDHVDRPGRVAAVLGSDRVPRRPLHLRRVPLRRDHPARGRRRPAARDPGPARAAVGPPAAPGVLPGRRSRGERPRPRAPRTSSSSSRSSPSRSPASTSAPTSVHGRRRCRTGRPTPSAS